MKTLISEINNKLKSIIEDLAVQKNDMENLLANIQEKIDAKIEEAKGYKSSVDAAKEKIAELEDNIISLEDDLKDLNDRFGNKNLNAILETGNKEINAKISSIQNDIAKQRDKIIELTEKARMIKDLLINLKRDKESKKSKLDNIAKAYTYYELELNKIIDYSSENPDDLIKDVSTTDKASEEDKYSNEPIDDTQVFDVIANLDKEDEDTDESDDSSNNENVLVSNFEDDKEEEQENISTDDSNNLNTFNEDLSEKAKEVPTNSSKEEKTQDEVDQAIDFKSLSDAIDQEYANIFGDSNDIKIDNDFNGTGNDIATKIDIDLDNKPEHEQNNPEESTNFNLFEGILNPEINEDMLNANTNETEDKDLDIKEESNDDVSNFFNNNGIDFSKFSEADQNKLRDNFNLNSYSKTLDILKEKNISLELIYESADIFKMIYSELANILNKLLMAGQSTQNISYVLNALPLINSIDLQDVIDSYGDAIKEASITDLILKAKHLKEIGGGIN